MDSLDDEMCMPVPENYVSLAQLKERWLKRQEEMRRGAEKIEGDGGRIIGDDGGLAIGEGGESSEKGNVAVAKAGSKDGERSKPRKMRNKTTNGNWIVKNASGVGKGKGGEIEIEREVEKGNQIVKNGSGNGEEEIRRKKKKKDYRRKKSLGKMNKAANGTMGTKIDAMGKNLEDSGAISDGIEIKARVSEDLNEHRGITIGVKGIEDDSGVPELEIVPKIAPKKEISNGGRSRQARSKRDGGIRGAGGSYHYRIKKENLVNEHEAKDEEDNGKKTNDSKVLELGSKIDELKLDGIVMVDHKTDESKAGTVIAAGKSGERRGKRNDPKRNGGKRNCYIRGEENGGRRGRGNGSKEYGKYNEFEGSSRSKNAMVWVKKGEKIEATNASQFETSGSNGAAVAGML